MSVAPTNKSRCSGNGRFRSCNGSISAAAEDKSATFTSEAAKGNTASVAARYEVETGRARLTAEANVDEVTLLTALSTDRRRGEECQSKYDQHCHFGFHISFSTFESPDDASGMDRMSSPLGDSEPEAQAAALPAAGGGHIW